MGLHPFLWLHPQIASSTNYQTLGSRHRYQVASGTLEEEDLAMPLAPFGQRKSAMVSGHKKKRKTWFGLLLCESIHDRTRNAPATPS